MHPPRIAILTGRRPATMAAVLALVAFAVALPGQAEAVRAGSDVASLTDSRCGHWYASHNHMPGGSRTLRVTGICTFPTTGYVVKLRRHVPQGINSKHLLLDKIVIPPSGPALPVITNVRVSYAEVTDMEYTNVTILPDGTTIPVVHPVRNSG